MSSLKILSLFEFFENTISMRIHPLMSFSKNFKYRIYDHLMIIPPARSKSRPCLLISHPRKENVTRPDTSVDGNDVNAIFVGRKICLKDFDESIIELLKQTTYSHYRLEKDYNLAPSMFVDIL